jgi:hypothetical protein
MLLPAPFAQYCIQLEYHICQRRAVSQVWSFPLRLPHRLFDAEESSVAPRTAFASGRRASPKIMARGRILVGIEQGVTMES